jgi:hypothetical protein
MPTKYTKLTEKIQMATQYLCIPNGQKEISKFHSKASQNAPTKTGGLVRK